MAEAKPKRERTDFRVSIPRDIYQSAEKQAKQHGWSIATYVSALISQQVICPGAVPLTSGQSQQDAKVITTDSGLASLGDELW